MKRIVVTGGKGGIGKTTLCTLMTEWFLSKGATVKIVDADISRGLQTWVDKCEDFGRNISTTKGDIEIIDTAGNTPASFKWIKSADWIFVPFKPNVADLEVVTEWYLSQRDELQKRVFFVPNEVANTLKQKDCLETIKKVIGKAKTHILPGLATRKAVYPPMLEGSASNLFESRIDKKAKSEIETLMGAIEKVIKW